MAVYATAQEVRSALLRDDLAEAGSAAQLTDAKIEREIANASAQVDAALSVRYNVPFTTVPSLVHEIVVDMACYLSDLTYRQDADFSGSMDPVWLRYSRSAQDLLEKLRTGTLVLPDPDPENPITNTGAAVYVNRYSGDMFIPEDFSLETQSRPYGIGWF